MPSVLGIDVGGTSIKTRLVDAQGRIVNESRLPTPQHDYLATELVGRVVELARDAEKMVNDLGALGLVVPGLVDAQRGYSIVAVNLGWHQLPLRSLTRAALMDAGLDLPMAFAQDVYAGALAETRSGAATGEAGTVVFMPIGTGVAVALVTQGVVNAGLSWMDEVGQEIISHGEHAGLRIESIASAAAVARRAGATDAKSVADRVRLGEPLALAVWSDCVDLIADMITRLARRTHCKKVIIGGGLAEAGATLFGPIIAAVSDRLGHAQTPEIVPAQNGDSAATIGAILLARDALQVPDPLLP